MGLKLTAACVSILPEVEGGRRVGAVSSAFPLGNALGSARRTPQWFQPPGCFPASVRQVGPSAAGYLQKSLLNLSEIADVDVSISSRRRFAFANKSENKRRGHNQGTSTSNTLVEGNDRLEELVDDSSKSSNKEEILALLRRIQSSISKGEPTVRKKKSARKDAQSPRRVSGAQRKDTQQKQAGDKTPSQQREQQPPQQRDPSSGEGLPSRANAEDTFVGVRKIDGLKLSELKELAKSRGLKGYSRLNKGELLLVLKRSPKLSDVT